eukprot:3492631-Rhodomonas_salina.1
MLVALEQSERGGHHGQKDWWTTTDGRSFETDGGQTWREGGREGAAGKRVGVGGVAGLPLLLSDLA